MQSTQTQAANLSRDSEGPLAFDASAFKRLKGLFALGLRRRAEDDIAACYAGRAWTDALEHQLINDITGTRSEPRS